MYNSSPFSRRYLLKSSAFGLMAASLPNVLFAEEFRPLLSKDETKVFHRYPSIDDEIVSEVVGKSHFDLERVKELVDARPELSRATWDWSFGDWESALGAASHVGRRDIAGYLISKGARPDIFTYAMLGHIEVVKEMVNSIPGIQSTAGPHGISLLQHAKAGLRPDYGITLTSEQIDSSNRLIHYLEELGSADPRATNLEMGMEEKEKYFGDYMYGDDPNDGLTVKVNMWKNLALGKLGKTGGSLYQKSPGVFSYNGIDSVEIHFEVQEGQVHSLTVHEPGLSLKAIKV